LTINRVLERHMKAATGAVLIAVVLAGCGGGSTTTASAPATAPPASDLRPPTSSSPSPTATTNTPPTHHRTKPQPLTTPSSAPLHVGASYTCHGKPLKAIKADGPVKLDPPIVKPGQSFAVIITDPRAKVALVNLAGVAPKPIQANAKERGGKLVATLRMPGYAGCGNKLVTVEGDVSAQAYVGVGN
jgi:hypothetical protein